jgi:hypothetical protein
MAWAIKFVEVIGEERVPMCIHPFPTIEEAQRWWKIQHSMYTVDGMVLYTQIKEE